MAGSKGTFSGRVRRIAYELWHGPEYILYKDEQNVLSGFCVLHLAMRKGETAKPTIESRAVYAILNSGEPTDAILRAVYWDRKTLIDYKEPYDAPFAIPATFLRLPLTTLQEWIDELDGVSAVIQTTSYDDDRLPICTLKVAPEYVTSVFEKTWQIVADDTSDLTRVWQTIWHQMGKALQTAPALAVTGLEESFAASQQIGPEYYDIQNYQPTLDLP
jgi:hypothetical protein